MATFDWPRLKRQITPLGSPQAEETQRADHGPRSTCSSGSSRQSSSARFEFCLSGIFVEPMATDVTKPTGDKASCQWLADEDVSIAELPFSDPPVERPPLFYDYLFSFLTDWFCSLKHPWWATTPLLRPFVQFSDRLVLFFKAPLISDHPSSATT